MNKLHGRIYERNLYHYPEETVCSLPELHCPGVAGRHQHDHPLKPPSRPCASRLSYVPGLLRPPAGTWPSSDDLCEQWSSTDTCNIQTYACTLHKHSHTVQTCARTPVYKHTHACTYAHKYDDHHNYILWGWSHLTVQRYIDHIITALVQEGRPWCGLIGPRWTPRKPSWKKRETRVARDRRQQRKVLHQAAESSATLTLGGNMRKGRRK